MAGRPKTREKRELLAAIGQDTADNLNLPTEARLEPVTWSDDLPAEAVTLGRDHGLSTAEITAHWGLSEEEMARLEEAHPALSAALSRARTGAEAWWERLVRKAMLTGDNRFPAGVWAMVVKARFPNYRERVEINHRIDITQLVRINVGSSGLLGEQGVIDAKPLPTNETSDFLAVGRDGLTPLDPPPPTPIGGGQGGAGEKRDAPHPNTGRSGK